MPTATIVQKLATGSTDEATNFATQAKTVTRLNAEVQPVQKAASEDERRPYAMTETQEEKIPHIEHVLDIGIPSCTARAIVQGVTQTEDADHNKPFAPAAKFFLHLTPTTIRKDDESTITASETRKIQDKTKCAKAHINQGVNRRPV
jgi:hypothetical protein